MQDKRYNISTEDKIMYAKVGNLAQLYQFFINNYCDGNKNVVLGVMNDYVYCLKDTFQLNYVLDLSLFRVHNII